MEGVGAHGGHVAAAKNQAHLAQVHGLSALAAFPLRREFQPDVWRKVQELRGKTYATACEATRASKGFYSLVNPQGLRARIRSRIRVRPAG